MVFPFWYLSNQSSLHHCRLSEGCFTQTERGERSLLGNNCIFLNSEAGLIWNLRALYFLPDIKSSWMALLVICSVNVSVQNQPHCPKTFFSSNWIFTQSGLMFLSVHGISWNTQFFHIIFTCKDFLMVWHRAISLLYLSPCSVSKWKTIHPYQLFHRIVHLWQPMLRFVVMEWCLKFCQPC